MLYVYTGNDAVAVRAEAHKFLDAYEEQGVEVLRLEAKDVTPALLRDRVGGQSLFGGADAPLVTFLDTPSEDAAALEAVTALAETLGTSSNTFVLADRKLLAADAKPLKAHATEFNEVKGGEKEERFNVFALADALARRDKKSLWVLYARAREAGLSAEELIGTLFWQLKTMRLAAATESAEEAGLKPFVYGKAKRALAKYGEGELAERTRALLALHHDARLGKRDIDLALERWVLGV